MDCDTYSVLLITGTIQVDANMPFVAIKDINERLRAYMETVKWAIVTSPFRAIVFCENSGYNFYQVEFDALAASRNKRFEYITFIGNKDKAFKHGKGYGEGEIIFYAMENSKLLRTADFFCKITGRVTVYNIEKCIGKMKNYFMHVEGEKKIDTRFYYVKKSDYNKCLRNAYKEVDDKHGIYLEHVFYKKVRDNKLRYRSFYDLPRIKGISGSTGLSYEGKRSLRTRRIISLMCKFDLYNSEILWLVIQKLSATRMKCRKRNIQHE